MLCDIEAEVPAFVHITPANVYDSKAMPEISYEHETRSTLHIRPWI